MIGVLLRKDPAVRTLPPLVLGGGILGAFAAVTVGLLFREGRHPELWNSLGGTLGALPVMQALLVAWVTAIGGWAGVRARAGEWHLSLPIPLRTQILLRVAALLLVAWAPIAVVSLVMGLAVREASVRQAMLASAGAGALAWGAWVLSCFAWKPGRSRLDSLPVFLGITVLGLALAYTALYHPRVGAPIALAVGIVAGARVWLGLPDVMELAVGGPGALVDEAESAPASVRSAPSSLRGWIARHTWRLGRNVALLIAVILLTFLTVGSDGPLRIEFAFTAFFAGQVISNSTRVLRAVGHLPIPRVRLAAWVLLPPLLAMLTGYAGMVVARAVTSPSDWVQEVDLIHQRPAKDGTGGGIQRVSVPGSLLRPVLGTDPVVVTAPWGESAAIAPRPLVPGLPLALVNPYDIVPESSIDFVAWQLSRAVRETYGTEIRAKELRDRYLSVLRGRVIGPFFGLKLRQDHPELTALRPPGWSGWNLIWVVLLWLVGAAWMTRSNVPSPDADVRERKRRGVHAFYWVGAAVFVSLLIGSHAIDMSLPGVSDAAAAALVRAVGGAEWVVPAVCLALLPLLYLWLARRFARMETPPPLERTWYQSPP